MLTRELLMERRRSLEADVIALNGALQQVDWDLDHLDANDADVPADGEKEE